MGWNMRTGTLGFIIASVVILSIIVIAGIVCAEEATAADFTVKNQLPSAGHLFGTDFMGRDMFVRTLAGLSMRRWACPRRFSGKLPTWFWGRSSTWSWGFPTCFC